jgi:hypothetical protein
MVGFLISILISTLISTLEAAVLRSVVIIVSSFALSVILLLFVRYVSGIPYHWNYHSTVESYVLGIYGIKCLIDTSYSDI